MKVFKALSFVAMLLVVVGALNWGLVGFFGFDLVAYLLPTAGVVVVYDIVGIAAVYVVVSCLFCCGCCHGGCKCGKDCKCDDKGGDCCDGKKGKGKKGCCC